MKPELAQMCVLLVSLSSLIMISTCTEQAVQIPIGYHGVHSIYFMNFDSEGSGEILSASRFLHSTPYHACLNQWTQLALFSLLMCVCFSVSLYEVAGYRTIDNNNTCDS